jgi:hypothetical protein
MGLDNYLYRLHKEAVKQKVDCKIDYEKYAVEEIGYFRKNSALHGFCGRIYDEHSGSDSDFNGCNLLLELDDLLQLKSLLSDNGLPSAQGFFWGLMTDQKYSDLTELVELMIKSYESYPDYVFVYNGNY